MFKSLPKKVRIIEVGPRDGLQNESAIIPTAAKAEFILKLAEAGVTSLEATSFVRAPKIPQMGDATELMELLRGKNALNGVDLSCLVPNMKGLEEALKSNVQEIAVFTATSNTFNKLNINATVEESKVRLLPVMEKAKQEKLKIRAYISTVFGCPYEGETSLEVLDDLIHFFIQNGAYEISLGDTIGVARPKQVATVIERIKKLYPLDKFAMHFHDTRGMAVANVLTSLEYGITNFDSSAGGLGGCPYAKGATGNVATEDLLYMFEDLGIETGINVDKIIEASLHILNILGKKSASRYLNAVCGQKGN